MIFLNELAFPQTYTPSSLMFIVISFCHLHHRTTEIIIIFIIIIIIMINISYSSLINNYKKIPPQKLTKYVQYKHCLTTSQYAIHQPYIERC